MSSATPIALATLRLPHGAPRPSDETLRQAVERDRQKLRLAPPATPMDIAVAGPYPVTVGGELLDEYVAWER